MFHMSKKIILNEISSNINFHENWTGENVVDAEARASRELGDMEGCSNKAS